MTCFRAGATEQLSQWHQLNNHQSNACINSSRSPTIQACLKPLHLIVLVWFWQLQQQQLQSAGSKLCNGCLQTFVLSQYISDCILRLFVQIQKASVQFSVADEVEYYVHGLICQAHAHSHCVTILTSDAAKRKGLKTACDRCRQNDTHNTVIGRSCYRVQCVKMKLGIFYKSLCGFKSNVLRDLQFMILLWS